MKAKDHAQPLIGKVTTDETVNRLIAGISDQIWGHGEHVGEAAEGPIPKPFEEPVNFPTLHHETIVSGKIRRA